MNKAEAIEYLQPIADSASLKRYSEALNMAIGALRRENDGWHSAKQPPKDEEMKLVVAETKSGIRSINRAYYMGGSWHGSGSMAGVTHWRELPELPEKTEADNG